MRLADVPVTLGTSASCAACSLEVVGRGHHSSQRHAVMTDAEPRASGGVREAGRNGPRTTAATAGGVLLTLASGQFLMTLDTSVMNVSIASVAADVGTTVTGIQGPSSTQGERSSGSAGKDGTITDVMSGEPIGLPGVLVQAALRRRAGPHLPLAGEPGAARAGSHRHIQPVVLGGRARAARPRGDPRPPAGPPGTPRGDRLWYQRSEDINAFERHLDRNGTKVVKFFLHLSKEEQRRRFLSRVENPDKHWKFSPADLAEPAHWEDYMVAFEDALSATSTRWAPWYVIPADHKHVDNPRRPAIQRPEAKRRG